MSRPRVDVVVLTMNDRPAEEAAAQATLLAQSGVDMRVVVVGNGCKPEVAPPASLMGVFAHPDDESLLASGVLAQHHAAGARTSVVTATWASTSHRVPEPAEALDVLGAGTPRLLGYADARNPASAPDGAVRLVDAPLDKAVGRLVAHIREIRPDIVIGHDVLGQLTGHPAHRRAHQITLLAVEAAGLPHLYPDAGEPWQSAALYAATHSQSGVGLLGPLLQSVGKTLLTVPEAYVTTTVDVSPWAAVKMRAILAHRTAAKPPASGLCPACSHACPSRNATRSSAPSTSPGSPPAPRRATLTGSSPDRPPSTRSLPHDRRRDDRHARP